MSLNKSKGNMYPWLDYTWNPIRGKCPHGCVYCFMKDRDVGPLRLDSKALADNLGTGRTIFVGSSTDMFAEAVPHDWIYQVLEKCNSHQNTYIFQSKNPVRFCAPTCSGNLADALPPRTILGTTLESNREYGQSIYAPRAWQRVSGLAMPQLDRFKKMVSMEPIVAFDLGTVLDWIRLISPTFVSIGADSKGHNLIEPTARELKDLIAELSVLTEVKLKKNLDRLLEAK